MAATVVITIDGHEDRREVNISLADLLPGDWRGRVESVTCRVEGHDPYDGAYPDTSHVADHINNRPLACTLRRPCWCEEYRY